MDNPTIKKTVWPERPKIEDIPLVEDEELFMLVLRLRRKLGDHADLICNKRGYGYLLQ